MLINKKSKQASVFAKNLWVKLKNSPRLKKYGVPLFTAWIAYILTLIPVSENLERCRSCTPFKSSISQKLVIYNLSNTRDTLFEYVAEPNQTVNIHFNNAILADETINLLSPFISKIPKTAQAIDFRPIQNKASKIFVKVMLNSPIAKPNTLSFLRELTPNKIQPDFKIKADGLDIAIEITQTSNIENTVNPDNSNLVIGNWSTRLSGVQIRIIPVKNTDIAFRFDLANWNPEKLFEEFYIPNMNHLDVGEISAQGLGTSASQGGMNPLIENLLCAAPNYEAVLWQGSKNFRNGACPRDKEYSVLKLTGFKIGKEDIQFSTSGYAWAKINGELTSNVMSFVKNKIENNPALNILIDRAKKTIELL